MGAQRKNAPPAPPKGGDASAKKGTATPAKEKTAKDKEAIKARMLMAREAAMLTDADKEIVAIYKRHKVKVEQYVGTLEWAKLHKAFAERGKSQTDKKK